MMEPCENCDRPDCPTLTTDASLGAYGGIRVRPAPDRTARLSAARMASKDCRAHKVDWRKRALDAELTIEVDQQRLADAGMRVGQCYGCDTPDAMADAIEALTAEIARLRSLVESAHAEGWIGLAWERTDARKALEAKP